MEQPEQRRISHSMSGLQPIIRRRERPKGKQNERNRGSISAEDSAQHAGDL